MPNMRRIIIATVALLIAGFGPIIAAELATRAYIAVKYGVPGKSYGLWKYDPELGAIHNENAYNTNAQTNDMGFRNTEPVLSPKPAGAYRFIIYGGSTVYCYNLKNDETWSNRLETLLRKEHDKSDQVLNGGAVAWSVAHEFARARRDIPALKPDYVILYTGLNETTNAALLAQSEVRMEELVRTGKFGVAARNLDQARWEKRNLALVRLYDYLVQPQIQRLRDSLSSTKEQDVSGPTVGQSASVIPDPFVLKHFLVTLEHFLEFLHSHNVRPIYVTMAHSRLRPSNNMLVGYSREGAKIALDHGVPVIDAQALVDNYRGDVRELFIETGAHWTAKGADLLAHFINDAIRDEIIHGTGARRKRPPT